MVGGLKCVTKLIPEMISQEVTRDFRSKRCGVVFCPTVVSQSLCLMANLGECQRFSSPSENFVDEVTPISELTAQHISPGISSIRWDLVVVQCHWDPFI